jgi:TatD DNase family protein
VYINIHSHKPATTNEWLIQNLYTDFEKTLLPGYYSTGIHPWYINAEWETAFSLLKKYSQHDNVLAIGECGLDKVCKTDFNLQQEVFLKQLFWANEIKKPMILHCVRAYDEIPGLLKKHHNQVPVIFHGFNKNEAVAEKIIADGHWISFGKALFQPAIKKVFAQIPLDKIFLETDDAAISIKMIYTEAAAIKQVSEETLSLQLIKNVKAVFNSRVLKQ